MTDKTLNRKIDSLLAKFEIQDILSILESKFREGEEFALTSLADSLKTARMQIEDSQSSPEPKTYQELYNLKLPEKPKLQEKPKLNIYVKGGVVQSIVSSLELDCFLIDSDGDSGTIRKPIEVAIEPEILETDRQSLETCECDDGSCPVCFGSCLNPVSEYIDLGQDLEDIKGFCSSCLEEVRKND